MIYASRKQYDKIVIACLRHEYKVDDYLKLYGKHMAESDQRQAVQEMTDRFKLRAADCKSSKECLSLANSVKEFAKFSTVCKKIAKEVKSDIMKQYPRGNFSWAFARVDI